MRFADGTSERLVEQVGMGASKIGDDGPSVALHDLEVGRGVVPVRGTEGGSSGLSSRGAVAGGT